MEARMMDKKAMDAARLTHMTCGDLKDALNFEHDLDVLRTALAMSKGGNAGYGTGKTAMKLIESAIRREEKSQKAVQA
jgi:hypothetical protein